MKSIQNIQYTSKPNLISPFIDEGLFLSHKPQKNSDYSMDNFEFVKGYNKELIIIGKGGYGKIYLAKNIKDNKEYAIKYVSKKKMKQMEVDSSIIKREIDIHIRITHPHIIKLYSYLEDRDNFYLALEYAPKGNLYQLIQEKKGMDENEAFYYFIQVASAIRFLHINGYAHRDIKPENILMVEDGGVKLCDFGWCVNVSKGERITFCGTYEYMAPEMINDEFYDRGIDLWSLGVLLYEMIHGYSPFRAHHLIKDAKSAMTEIFINIKNNNYTINKNISKECIDLIDKLLTIDTKKRIKIDELFLHPWVVNKEKEYFPNFHRAKENININNNNNNGINKIKQKNIILKKSTDFINYKKEQENNYNQELIQNKVNNENKESSNNNTIKYSNYFKNNKSYCLITNKSNSKNNGIYFIQGQCDNNNKKIIEKKTTEQEKIKQKDNDINNNVNNNNFILTEQNENEDIDKIKKPERNAFSPTIEKKDFNSKNNFIYRINSKKKKLNKLPKVNRKNTRNKNNIIQDNENKDIKENKILKINSYDNKDINNINININMNEKIILNKNEEKIKNLTKNKTEKKLTLKSQNQNQDLDEYLKRQKEVNELSIKMQKIKEQKEITINKLKKIEEKKRREESLRKLYDSQKSSTSYDYYSKKNKSLKNQFSYVSRKHIPKSEIGAYIIKPSKKESDSNSNNNNKLIKNKEKLKDKRSKSFQQLLNENLLENKLKNLYKERSKKKLTNFENINKDELINTNKNFKRFQKKVLHLKKRNRFNIKTDDNIYKCISTLDKNLNENKLLKSNLQQKYLKSNKSIQNIFYYTFYNCLFDNNQNNNLTKNYFINSNIYNNKTNFIKKNKESKSISTEKNILKSKNIYKFKKELNKENILSNYSTERKVDKFKHKIQYSDIKNKDGINKENHAFPNYKINFHNYNKVRSVSNNKELII